MNLGTKNGETIDLKFAEEVVKNNIKMVRDKQVLFNGLTTNKLRNLLDLVNNIYSVVINNNEKELSESVKDKIAYLKVKFAYEVGKDTDRFRPVKTFVEQTYVKDLIDDVLQNGSRKQFLDYCKYFEALVAYSKYYGMGDK